MFGQEQVLILEMQPIKCLCCQQEVWMFFKSDADAYSRQCSKCGSWLISTLLNYELFESHIDWLRSQWLP